MYRPTPTDCPRSRHCRRMNAGWSRRPLRGCCLAHLGLVAAGRTAAPAVVATSLRQTKSSSERSNLNFYAELAAEHDPAKSFPAPTELPRVSSRPAGRLAKWIARGTVDNIAFPSSFTAINPAMRQLKRQNSPPASSPPSPLPSNARSSRPRRCSTSGSRPTSWSAWDCVVRYQPRRA